MTSEYKVSISVLANNQDDLNTALAHRLSRDEDYGFPYEIKIVAIEQVEP